MSQTGYLILAISILLALLVVFIVSFILYRRTPVPKGCENIKISDENCSACNNTSCEHHISREEDNK